MKCASCRCATECAFARAAGMLENVNAIYVGSPVRFAVVVYMRTPQPMTQFYSQFPYFWATPLGTLEAVAPDAILPGEWK